MANDWCCQGAKDRFDSRLDCGNFLVAGLSGFSRRETRFYAGFNVAHRRDRSNVLSANQALRDVAEEEGITNIKLHANGVVSYCEHCGAHLKTHYGEDGGLLRDEEYVRAMHDVFR